MDTQTTNAPRFRFGAFELDLRTGELRKNGTVTNLPPQPFKILTLLVNHPGELVTREEIQEQIWGNDTFVDFENGLNFAIKRIRTVLGDDAESPRYIETLPRRGYRFIAPVELVNGNGSSFNRGDVAASLNGQPSMNGADAAPALAESLSAAPQSQPAAGVTMPLHSWSRVGWAVGALALLALIGAAAFFRVVHAPINPPLKFHDRDWVLVSRFENRTGEPVLDGTVDFAVARELANSQFVGIVPPERVGDDLRLMKKPAGTPLDPALARELCLRDGGIRALITGRVEKLGTTYVLSAGILDPATDVQVAGVSVQASDLNAMLAAARELSNRLREGLGETLPAIQESNLKLEKATTPSLRALQLYSQAMAIAYDRGPLEGPIPLLEQALAEDPNFASAHLLLAYCYSNLGKKSQADPHFEKAFELADTTTESERLFIQASYYDAVKRDRKKAIQAYEALVLLYPDHFWGTNNLAMELLTLGSSDEGTKLVGRRADLRPFNFGSNANAWDILSNWGYADEARRYLARARSLLTPEAEKSYPDLAIEVEAADAESDLNNWNVPKALEEAQRLAGTYAARPDESRDALAEEVGLLYLNLGQLSTATEWFEKLSPEYNDRYPDLRELAEARGDRAAMRSAIQQQFARKLFGPGLALHLAKLGMLEESRQVIAGMEKQGREAFWTNPAKGGLALAEGRRKQAIPLLKEAVKGRGKSHNPIISMAADLLATAYEQQGEIHDAIQTLKPLEEAHQLRPDASFHLFKLYMKAKDAKGAEQVEANLLRRLAYADPDHPIFFQLHRQEKLDAAIVSKP